MTSTSTLAASSFSSGEPLMRPSLSRVRTGLIPCVWSVCVCVCVCVGGGGGGVGESLHVWSVYVSAITQNIHTFSAKPCSS